jgi:hypothetical protein
MRIIDTLEKCGIRDGWVSQRHGKQMRMSEFGSYVFDMLLEMQKDRPDLIHPDIDVLEDFGLARSERRGATTRAQIAKVGEQMEYQRRRCRKQMMETFLELSLAL